MDPLSRYDLRNSIADARRERHDAHCFPVDFLLQREEQPLEQWIADHAHLHGSQGPKITHFETIGNAPESPQSQRDEARGQGGGNGVAKMDVRNAAGRAVGQNHKFQEGPAPAVKSLRVIVVHRQVVHPDALHGLDFVSRLVVPGDQLHRHPRLHQRLGQVVGARGAAFGQGGEVLVDIGDFHWVDGP